MPFLAWKRTKSEACHPAALRGELERLCSNVRVHALFEWFSRHEREIAGVQMAITTIAAPPFAEQERAAWLAERLKSLGLPASIDAAGNLLAARPGAAAEEPAVAVSAHLDTVFPAGTPLEVRREQQRLLGPGIGDNGSGLAALWALACAFQELAIPTLRPLLFVGNVGEEGEGNLRGMRHLYRGYLSGPAAEAVIPDASLAPSIAQLIALDGSGVGNIVSQALGSRRFEAVITGPGGHSWSDYGTPNPIVAAALAVRELSRIPLPLNPRTTMNVGIVEGGTSVNAIPSRVSFKVDLRSSDPRRLDVLEQELRRAVEAACREVQADSHLAGMALEHSVTLLGERPAGELPDSSPLLAAVRAVDARLGIASQLQRASTDANIPLSLGLEAISLGCGGNGGGAHTVEEWFDPVGRELGLRRLALLVLLLAGMPQRSDEPGADASATASPRLDTCREP